jgi:hypothetical protein
MLLERIAGAECFAIFGAQTVAYGAYVALRSLYNCVPECFIVGSVSDNPQNIDGVPVRTIDDCDLALATLIVVAVSDLLQDEVGDTLKRRGFFNLLFLNSDLEFQLLSAYYDEIGEFSCLSESEAKMNIGEFAVYQAKSVHDVPLKTLPPHREWEISIQAGATLTDRRIAGLTDDLGDNISEKNRQYYEATVIYWIWKNVKSKWKGICHYRRHFDITNKQIFELAKEEIDAVLTLPYMCYPNAAAQFQRFVSDDVYNATLSALKTLYPEKHDNYLKILGGRYNYAYNMLIARATVYDAYCEWLFSILNFIETKSDKITEIASTRALSYISEILTSIYFLSNANGLNIRFAKRKIFV